MIHWQPWREEYQLVVLGYMIWAEIFVDKKSYQDSDGVLKKVMKLSFYNFGKKEVLFDLRVCEINVEERTIHFKEYIEKISGAFMLPEPHIKYR